MRLKDPAKKTAIRDATISIVNQLGLEGASISKIAKEAGVSAASIYTYFENKEDMLEALYIELKDEMWNATMNAVDESDSHETLFRNGWMALYRFVLSNPEEFRFIEQFSNSPAIRSDQLKSVRAKHAKLVELYKAAKRDGVMRKLPDEIIGAYLFAPLTHLAKLELNRDYRPTKKVLHEAFEAAWRSVSIGGTSR